MMKYRSATVAKHKKRRNGVSQSQDEAFMQVKHKLDGLWYYKLFSQWGIVYDEAEDIVQDVTENILIKLDSFEGRDEASLYTWCNQVFHNMVKNYFRDKNGVSKGWNKEIPYCYRWDLEQKDDKYLLSSGSLSVGGDKLYRDLYSNTLIENVTKIIEDSDLPAKTIQVFKMHFLDYMSYEAIEEDCGMKQVTVRQHVFQIRKYLKGIDGLFD